jgi:hypothetical protein
MNLGLVGDETIELVADMNWVQAKFLEILNRTKPDWLVTFDLPGTAKLRKFAHQRLVLVEWHYKPVNCELAVVDPNILAYSDYLVVFSNGQPHSLIDSVRQGKVLEVNYLSKEEKWHEYA